MAIEFETLGIPFRREVELPAHYKGRLLNTKYRADFLCYDSVIVELKALKGVGQAEEAQVINYLKLGAFKVGLLLNFGERSLFYRRFVNDGAAAARS